MPKAEYEAITTEDDPGNLRLKFNPKDGSKRVLSATISPFYGSNLTSFKFGDQELICTDEEALRQKKFTGTFVMWPIPNRLRDRKYNFTGRNYSIKNLQRPEGGPHIVHGLVYDQPWSVGEIKTTPNFAHAQTYIEHDEPNPNFDGYPFASRLSLDYFLSGSGLRIIYSVMNNSDYLMPFGFGLHPYFLTGSDKNTVNIAVPANYLMETDFEQLPTGKLIDVAEAGLDLREGRSLTQVVTDSTFTGLIPGNYATLDLTKSGTKLVIATSEDFSHIALYSPSDKPFVCLESQTCSADALNLHARGLIDQAHLQILRSGQIAQGFIEYQVSNLRKGN